jgi:hypothetical protein
VPVSYAVGRISGERLRVVPLSIVELQLRMKNRSKKGMDINFKEVLTLVYELLLNYRVRIFLFYAKSRSFKKKGSK